MKPDAGDATGFSSLSASDYVIWWTAPGDPGPWNRTCGVEGVFN